MDNRSSPAGRVPPHNEEAERALLGGLLLDGNALAKVEDLLKAEDFYSHRHTIIFNTIKSLVEKDTEADIVSLTQQLRHDSVLDKVGGAAYVAALTEVVASSANIRYYGGIVRDCSVRRELLRLSAKMGEEAYNLSKESAQILDEVERDVFQVSHASIPQKPIPASVVVTETYDSIESKAHNSTQIAGIPSGFPDLDAMLSGFHDAEFVIVGARPSIGKTALAVSMIDNISVKNRIECGLFTLEMTNMALMQRLISRQGRVSANKLRTGMMSASELNALAAAIDPIYDAPLWIVDTPYMRIVDIRAIARRMVAELHVKIVFIDYVTLIATDNNDIPRHEQVAAISRALKGMARELHIPVVALSQVTRDSEGRKPNLAQIRESGSLEQDADVVMFLHRERESEREFSDAVEDDEQGIDTDLIVAKQRNGPVGSVKLKFVRRFVSFESPDAHTP